MKYCVSKKVQTPKKSIKKGNYTVFVNIFKLNTNILSNYRDKANKLILLAPVTPVCLTQQYMTS
jgi:hypothetical protein